MMIKKIIPSLLSLILLLLTSGYLFAADANINIPLGIGQSEFNTVTEELGLSVAYVPLAPAENLGITGIDVGVEFTAVDIDEDLFRGVMSDPPGQLVFPRLHIQKGLPFGIDLGAIYSRVPNSNISLAGGEIKWAILTGTAATPALALRASYTRLIGISSLDLETFGADLSISKGILFLTPYAGIGQVLIKASSDLVGLEDTASKTRGFLGLKASLLPLSIVGEYDISEVSSFSLRLNISF
ncbi:MAG: hypothetical protein HZA13_04010 [Nitrospirae bacterium]|nr:hypothetical protein [Nitrospirota bacterium]